MSPLYQHTRALFGYFHGIPSLILPRDAGFPEKNRPFSERLKIHELFLSLKKARHLRDTLYLLETVSSCLRNKGGHLAVTRIDTFLLTPFTCHL